MTLRRLLLGLMISFLFGCGELEIPEVSVEFLEYDEEMARFQLQADPEPTRDLAVLLNFNSDGETFHIWQAIPEESGTKEFAIELDKYVSWGRGDSEFREDQPQGLSCWGPGAFIQCYIWRVSIGESLKASNDTGQNTRG